MKTIVWGNYKGGVGKTTSTYQVATYFSDFGKKVLLIDLDPQASLSEICARKDNKDLKNYNETQVFNYIVELYTRYINSKKDIDFSLLMGEKQTPIKNILSNMPIKIQNIKNKEKGLFFIPTSISFENCRLNELASNMQKTNNFNIFLFQLFINDIENENFDYLFIDCPPTSNFLTQSVFLASDYYIIPTIIDDISAHGVIDYIKEIRKTRLKYSAIENMGDILLKKVFGEETQLIGIFETLYKNRPGYASNTGEIKQLDKEINEHNIYTLISQKKL